MNYFKLSKFFLYLVPFTIVIVSTSTLFPFIVGKYVWFRTITDLSLIFFLLGLFLNKEARNYETHLKNWLRTPLGMAVSIFAFIFLIASFFAFDSKIAFWSNFERGEGALQILHLYIFFVLLGTLFRERRDWQKIFWLSAIAGFLMIFYGLGAGLKFVDAEFITAENGGGQPTWSGKGGVLFQIFRNFVGPSFKDESYRFQGSIGNPAYVATYIIFMFFYVGYLILSLKQRKSFKNILLMVLLLLFFTFFILAATRGAFIGLLAAMFLGILFLAYLAKKWRVKLLVLAVSIILILVAMNAFKNTLFKDFPARRLFDISVSARTLQDRIYIWETALRGFKERPLLGWGPENFAQVFDRYYPQKFFTPERGFGAWFDRAHNIFLGYLVETGILGLLSYLSIFVVFYLQFFMMVKKTGSVVDGNKEGQKKVSSSSARKDYIMKFIIFALPSAYLVQGLVLFEVLIIYLNLFLFLAFANYKFNERLMSNP